MRSLKSIELSKNFKRRFSNSSEIFLKCKELDKKKSWKGSRMRVRILFKLLSQFRMIDFPKHMGSYYKLPILANLSNKKVKFLKLWLVSN